MCGRTVICKQTLHIDLCDVNTSISYQEVGTFPGHSGVHLHIKRFDSTKIAVTIIFRQSLIFVKFLKFCNVLIILNLLYLHTLGKSLTETQWRSIKTLKEK